MNATTTTRRLTKADLPEGYSVVKEQYEVPCDHIACDTMHRHLYNNTYEDRVLVDLYNMDGEQIGTRWETRFHMTQRTEWVILLDDHRVGSAHGTQQEAFGEAMTGVTI